MFQNTKRSGCFNQSVIKQQQESGILTFVGSLSWHSAKVILSI
jgi:hypothetical protein